jgi:uncharacterized protein (DUF305 family)
MLQRRLGAASCPSLWIPDSVSSYRRSLQVFVGAIAIGAIAPAMTSAQSSSAAPSSTGGKSRPVVAKDLEFVRGMITHHGQALVMAALVPSRSKRTDLSALAERITVSQQDEIGMMQRWLRDHGASAESPMHDMAGMDHHTMTMPGMLTEAQLAALKSADGIAFDTLFLRGMIQHHEGAITMVADLLHTTGAAQDAQLFEFAGDIQTDQRAEIRRMQALLNRLTNRRTSVPARAATSPSPRVP